MMFDAITSCKYTAHERVAFIFFLSLQFRADPSTGDETTDVHVSRDRKNFFKKKRKIKWLKVNAS